MSFFENPDFLICFLIALILGISPLSGQIPGNLDQYWTDDVISEVPVEAVEILWEQDGRMNPASALRAYKKGETFTPLKEYDLETRRNPGVYWVYLDIGDKDVKDRSKDVICVSENQYYKFGRLEFYFVKNGKIIGVKKTGRNWNVQSRERALSYSKDCISLLPNQFSDDVDILLRIRQPKKFNPELLFYLSTEETEWSKRVNRMEQNVSVYLFMAGFLGIQLFFLVFTIIQYSQLKESAYLYYGIYVIGILIYNAEHFEWETDIIGIFSYTMRWHYYYEVPLASIIYFAYIRFVDAFLNFKVNSPFTHRIIKWGGLAILSLPLIDIILRMIGGTTMSMFAYDFFRVLLILACLAILVLVLRIDRLSLDNNLIYDRKLGHFIIAGSLFLLLGAGVVFGLKIVPQESLYSLGPIWGFGLNYSRVGMLLENAIFVFGLAYKTRGTIFQLQQEIKDTEDLAKRARINPHTATNIANAIRSLLAQNRVRRAYRYSELFSGFLRRQYEFSLKKNITLEEEVEVVGQYITLQNLRFDGAVEYKLDSSGLDLSFYSVPPGILLPYVENAIDHGLRSKEGERCLTIHVDVNSLEQLTIAIEDNGTGLNGTQVEFPAKKRSTGLRELENWLQNRGIEVEIGNRIKNDSSSGVKVKIIFP